MNLYSLEHPNQLYDEALAIIARKDQQIEQLKGRTERKNMPDYAWCTYDKTHGWHPIVGDAPEVKELKALVCELSLALVEPLEPDRLDKLLQKAKAAVE